MKEEILKIFDKHFLDVLGETRTRKICRDISKCLKNKPRKGSYIEFCKDCEHLMCNWCKYQDRNKKECGAIPRWYQYAWNCPTAEK